jgi:hypothetical protein
MLHRSPNNEFLAALAAHLPNVYDSLVPDLIKVPLKKDIMSFDTEESPTWVWFPISGAVSILAKVDQCVIEAPMVGCEGAIELLSIAGTNGIRLYTRVRIEGKSLEINANILRHVFQQKSEAYELIVNCVTGLFERLAILSICNRFHSIQRHLASRHLLMLECRNSNSTAVTHTNLAGLIGVARSVATRTMLEFRRARRGGSWRAQIINIKRSPFEHIALSCHTFIHHDKYISSVAAPP